jgi:nucleoside phosphorylase
MFHSVLIVAAHEPELDAVRACLPSGGQVASGRIRIAAQAVGVGVVQATVGTMQALAAYEPDAVVLTGSCGVLPTRDIELLACVAPASFRLVCLGEVMHASIMPPVVQAHVPTDDSLRRALMRADTLREVRAATTLGITTQQAMAENIATWSSCDVENMEGFGVAQACQSFAVPFAALFSVTNHVGPEGRTQFQQYATPAADRCAEVIVRWLRALETTHRDPS